MSTRKVVVELTEPQIRALLHAAGYWEDNHDPDHGVADAEDISPGERRRAPVVARARRVLYDALNPGTPLPRVPEHPLNR